MLLLIGGTFFLVAWIKGPLPESSETSHQMDQPLPRSIARLEPDADRSVDIEIEGDKVLTVRLDLEEGQFDIAPGAFGGSIQVDADFQEGLHRLEPEWSEGAHGPVFALRFRGGGTIADIQKLLHGQLDEEARVRVDLPQGVPMHLSIQVSKCEADIDLSGLSLLSLTFEHAMGASVLLFREPNPIAMETFDIRAKMGDVEIAGIGHASARELLFNGRMGDFRLDFNGDWREDTVASIDMMMGSATLRVPRDVALEHDNRYVIFGGVDASRRSSRSEPERETQKTLTLETSVRFGDISVR